MKKVITYGTFDLFHAGHLSLLKRAKALGDYLIVGVTTEHFDEARGKMNVIDSIVERIENVKGTGLADQIIVEDHEGQKIDDIQKYGVDVFTVGSDWVGAFDYLKAFCEVEYLERTPAVSSTALRGDRFKLVKIGIVGTGRIAPRFVREAQYVSGALVTCAYNPVADSARQFERWTKIPVYTGEYEEFLEQVDAVYIASPHETHVDYASRAMGMGRHVLCEKPLSFTKREAVELYGQAKRQGMVLIEGIKTAYCPGFQQMINVAMSGKIGRICDVEACFSRLADVDSREMTDRQYGGAFLEFGGYPLLPIIKLLGHDYREVMVDSIDDEHGVDLYTKIHLRYAHGFGMAKTGVGVKSEGQLVIAGTAGYILAPSPWWQTRKFEIRYENPGRIELYQPVFQGDGLRYELSEFVSRINGRSTNGFKLTEEESIAMADITEQFMRKRSLGMGGRR